MAKSRWSRIAGPLLRPAVRVSSSVDAHARRLDRRGPLLDFALEKLAEILRGGALVRHDLGTGFFERLTHCRRLHRLHDVAIELVDHRFGGTLGQEDRAPGISFKILHAL